jgi:hypothetical protein
MPGIPLSHGWTLRFADLIILQDGGELRTLREAGNYVPKLPKREHDTPEWQAAMQALSLVVEYGGDATLPRIGIMSQKN